MARTHVVLVGEAGDRAGLMRARRVECDERVLGSVGHEEIADWRLHQRRITHRRQRGSRIDRHRDPAGDSCSADGRQSRHVAWRCRAAAALKNRSDGAEHGQRRGSRAERATRRFIATRVGYVLIMSGVHRLR